MSTVISVENISKQYRLGEVGRGTLKHDFNAWWHRIRGKEDPYLRIGETNDRTVKGSSDYVWALEDINFEVKQGEVLGIIGRNGAGKSTLLKILSKVTQPTTGQIKVKGRIASLLEVGTGFHPELSGRENIFLNGAILGMSKKEIARKFDEIVDFAGVERYIDTPVKRYSSGMYVRLAFGVAAHLEPEILIVDEVLAVGDAEFQKKCLGKMKDVSDREGRTVLFVSHNMAAIKNLCTNCLLLSNGSLLQIDSTSKVLGEYARMLTNKKVAIGQQTSISKTEVLGTKSEINYFTNTVGFTEFSLSATLIFQNKSRLTNCYVNFVLEDIEQLVILHHRTDFSLDENPSFDVGVHEVNIEVPKLSIKPGIYNYSFRLYCEDEINNFILDSEKETIEVEGLVIGGLIGGNCKWSISK